MSTNLNEIRRVQLLIHENKIRKVKMTWVKSNADMLHVMKWLYLRTYVKLSMVVFAASAPLTNQNERWRYGSSSKAICILWRLLSSNESVSVPECCFFLFVFLTFLFTFIFNFLHFINIWKNKCLYVKKAVNIFYVAAFINALILCCCYRIKTTILFWYVRVDV